MPADRCFTPSPSGYAMCRERCRHPASQRRYDAWRLTAWRSHHRAGTCACPMPAEVLSWQMRPAEPCRVLSVEYVIARNSPQATLARCAAAGLCGGQAREAKVQGRARVRVQGQAGQKDRSTVNKQARVQGHARHFSGPAQEGVMFHAARMQRTLHHALRCCHAGFNCS